MTPRELLQMQLRLGEHAFTRFMLNHGRDYAIGPETFAGPRDPQGQCYRNAALLAFRDDAMTYVEGNVSVHTVPISHAWCINADGIVIDPTITPDVEIGDYFGVPFRTDYVRKACLHNRFYGLLDIFSARKTLPKLIELGLEDGQRWLLETKRKKA